MSYKYTITQENTNNKTRLTYEFSAEDETDMVEELNTFMVSIGFAQSGFLQLVDDGEDLIDDLDSEVREFYGESRNPDVEGFMNFEFPEGQGQTDYNFYSSDMEMIAEKSQENGQTYSSWPFPLDRPSQSTYRVDSIYTTNSEEPKSDTTYYGA